MAEFNIEKSQSKNIDMDKVDVNNQNDMRVSIQKLPGKDRVSKPLSPITTPKLFEVSNIGIDLLENKNRKRSQSHSMNMDFIGSDDMNLDMSIGDFEAESRDKKVNLFDQLQKKSDNYPKDQESSKDRYKSRRGDESIERSRERYNSYRDSDRDRNRDYDRDRNRDYDRDRNRDSDRDRNRDSDRDRNRDSDRDRNKDDLKRHYNSMPTLGQETVDDLHIGSENRSLNQSLGEMNLSLDDLDQHFKDGLDPYEDIPAVSSDKEAISVDAKVREDKKKEPEEEKDDLEDMNIDELLSECDNLKQKHNIHIPSHFNRKTPVNEIRAFIRRERKKRERNNAEKLGAKILMTTITALEFLNNKFDPFDLKLDGWSESIHENIDDYNDVFGELYEKYKTSSKVPPEVKLIMMVGGSAAMVHLTNTMFKSSLPGMEEMMKQNPDMMKQFAQAAMNQMGQSVPAGMFGNNQGSSAPPPPQPPYHQSPPQVPPQPFNRPTPVFNKQEPPKPTMRGPTLNMPELNIKQPNGTQPPKQQPAGPLRPQGPPTLSNMAPGPAAPRREMRGPAGLGVDDILKELEMNKKAPSPKNGSPNGSVISKGDNNRRTIRLNI
jgi:hypothetical protein